MNLWAWYMLFKLLSLRVICYTTMQLELSVIKILWDGADISHIHLHQAKWMWTQLSALVHLNLKGGGRVCYTHLSCCLWLEPGVHIPAHKVNWFHSSNSKWFPICKLLEPCLFFNTNHLLACGKWNHEIMQLYYNQRCLKLYMQIGCYPLQTAVVKALILFIFCVTKMETLPHAVNASGEGEHYGRLARPPVTAKGHQGNQAKKWGSSKTRFLHRPKARTMGPMA